MLMQSMSLSQSQSQSQDNDEISNQPNIVIDEIIRSLSLLTLDLSKLSNRTDIKRVLGDLEKQISKNSPDFIVLIGCSRFVQVDLNNKEWCKYYYISQPNFLSQNMQTHLNSSTQLQQQTLYSRTHIVLSRYPLTRSESFGIPLVHVVESAIPFNELPMRYEYDDPSVQYINMDKITIVVSMDDEKVDEQHIVSIKGMVDKITAVPNNVIVCGINNNKTNNVLNENFKLASDDVYYSSEAWECIEFVERNKFYKFHLSCMDNE